MVFSAAFYALGAVMQRKMKDLPYDVAVFWYQFFGMFCYSVWIVSESLIELDFQIYA